MRHLLAKNCPSLIYMVTMDTFPEECDPLSLASVDGPGLVTYQSLATADWSSCKPLILRFTWALLWEFWNKTDIKEPGFFWLPTCWDVKIRAFCGLVSHLVDHRKRVSSCGKKQRWNMVCEELSKGSWTLGSSCYWSPDTCQVLNCLLYPTNTIKSCFCLSYLELVFSNQVSLQAHGHLIGLTSLVPI